MLRHALIAPLLLVAAACASAPLALQVVASAEVAEAEPSEEIQCMTDCLDDNTETCDSCAAHCLFRGSESIASNF